TGWAGTARLIRGQILSLKESEYVEAARALGASNTRIIFKHIVPNCIAPIIISATLGMGGAIMTEASLSFLGLGAQPPIPSWGSMIDYAKDFLRTNLWYSFFPGLAIMITVFGFNLLGDGLRDALDPRLKV
ncbi:MAG TPA: ABC transporter permease, partial [bacterium]|nr:ABC transporter permease [bacterium]